MPYERPSIAQKPILDIRRAFLRDYIDHYAAIAKVDRQLLNQKIPRDTFASILHQVGEILLDNAHEMATKNGPVREFLDRNSLPSSIAPYLPDDFRVFCLMLNALKQWVSAEQMATDRFFLAGNVRDELKMLASDCIVTGESLVGTDVDLHHPVRDGRPPVPLSKKGHAIIEGQIKNQKAKASRIE